MLRSGIIVALTLIINNQKFTIGCVGLQRLMTDIDELLFIYIIN